MNQKIKLSQVGGLAYILVLFSYMGTTSNIILPLAKQDSWISILIAFTVGIIPLFIFIKIMDFEPNVSIIEKTRILFGKTIGNFINIIMGIFLLLFASYAFWNLDIFVSSQYLYRTPTFFIGICTSICIIYLLSQNLSTILRTIFIMFIIGLFLYTFGALVLVWQIKIVNFKPILESGVVPPLITSLQCIAYNVLPLFLITLIPKNRIENVHKLGKTIIGFYILSGFIIFLIVVITIGIFGPKLSSIYEYTAFHLLKNISVLGVINRIESTLSIRWLLYLITFITTCLYFILTTIKSLFKNFNEKYNGVLATILTLIVLFLSETILKNNIEKEFYAERIFPIVNGVFLFIIPLIIFISIKIKKTNQS